MTQNKSKSKAQPQPQAQAQAQPQSQPQAQAPSEPPAPIPRLTDLERLPYGGMPGRCVCGPEDPPNHYDAMLTNGFVRRQAEARLSWDGHHLLQLLEQREVEILRMMDGGRPLVLEPGEYAARFWSCCRRPVWTSYVFVCTKGQGLEYCSRYVKWIEVKSPLRPEVQATTGPSALLVHDELAQQFERAQDELLQHIVHLGRTMEARPSDQVLLELRRRKDQYADLAALAQQNNERQASRGLQPQQSQQPQHRQELREQLSQVKQQMRVRRRRILEMRQLQLQQMLQVHDQQLQLDQQLKQLQLSASGEQSVLDTQQQGLQPQEQQQPHQLGHQQQPQQPNQMELLHPQPQRQQLQQQQLEWIRQELENQQLE